MSNVSLQADAGAAGMMAEERAARARVALPAELLAEFARQGEELTMRRGARVVREGDVADRLFLIREGRVRVYHADDAGKEIELNVLGPGEYFGELLLGSQVRTATVKALTAVRLSVITREVFEQVVARRPDVAFHVIQTLIARVKALTEDVGGLALLDVYGRLAALLTHSAVPVAEVRVAPFMSQQTIAQRLGASRSMINKLMNGLIVGGYIEVSRQRIVLNRPLPKRW